MWKNDHRGAHRFRLLQMYCLTTLTAALELCRATEPGLLTGHTRETTWTFKRISQEEETDDRANCIAESASHAIAALCYQENVSTCRRYAQD